MLQWVRCIVVDVAIFGRMPHGGINHDKFNTSTFATSDIKLIGDQNFLKSTFLLFLADLSGMALYSFHGWTTVEVADPPLDKTHIMYSQCRAP